MWYYTFPSGWYWFTGIFFILLWFSVGIISAKKSCLRRVAIAYLNLPAILAVIVILYHEFFAGWDGINMVSFLLSQYFFLPLILVANRLLQLLPIETVRLSYLSITAFFMLLIISYIGHKLGTNPEWEDDYAD